MKLLLIADPPQDQHATLRQRAPTEDRKERGTDGAEREDRGTDAGSGPMASKPTIATAVAPTNVASSTFAATRDRRCSLDSQPQMSESLMAQPAS